MTAKKNETPEEQEERRRVSRERKNAKDRARRRDPEVRERERELSRERENRRRQAPDYRARSRERQRKTRQQRRQLLDSVAPPRFLPPDHPRDRKRTESPESREKRKELMREARLKDGFREKVLMWRERRRASLIAAREAVADLALMEAELLALTADLVEADPTSGDGEG